MHQRILGVLSPELRHSVGPMACVNASLFKDHGLTAVLAILYVHKQSCYLLSLQIHRHPAGSLDGAVSLGSVCVNHGHSASAEI